MHPVIVTCGVVFLAEGISELLFPAFVRTTLARAAADVPVQPLGGIYCLIAIALNYWSGGYAARAVVLAISAALFAIGVAGIILPEQSIRRFLGSACTLPEMFWRFWGVLMIGLGTYLVLAR